MSTSECVHTVVTARGKSLEGRVHCLSKKEQAVPSHMTLARLGLMVRISPKGWECVPGNEGTLVNKSC